MAVAEHEVTSLNLLYQQSNTQVSNMNREKQQIFNRSQMIIIIVELLVDCCMNCLIVSIFPHIVDSQMSRYEPVFLSRTPL